MARIREEEKKVTANLLKTDYAKVENLMMLKTRANNCQEKGSGLFESLEMAHEKALVDGKCSVTQKEIKQEKDGDKAQKRRVLNDDDGMRVEQRQGPVMDEGVVRKNLGGVKRGI